MREEHRRGGRNTTVTSLIVKRRCVSVTSIWLSLRLASVISVEIIEMLPELAEEPSESGTKSAKVVDLMDALRQSLERPRQIGARKPAARRRSAA